MRNLSVIKGMYQGNGVTRRFAIPFEYRDTSQIRVTIATQVKDNYENVAADYTYKLLDIDDYIVDTASQEIVYPKLSQDNPITQQQYLTVWRDTDLLQLMDLTNQGGAWPESIEAALDKLTQIVQEVTDSVSRSVKVNIGSPQTPDELIGLLRDYVNQSHNYADDAEQSALSAATYSAPLWNATTQYPTGATVRYTDGCTYRAMYGNINKVPTDQRYWTMVVPYKRDDFFQLDDDGNIMPTEYPTYSPLYVLDSNGDIMPREEL